MLGFDQNTESKPKIDISGNIFDFLKYKIVWHGSSLELRKAWPHGWQKLLRQYKTLQVHKRSFEVFKFEVLFLRPMFL